MKFFGITGLLATAILLATTTAVLADHHGGGKSKNIIETARDAGQFTTLLTAIEAAGLTDTLSGPGPFTVFAPTDAAFDQIPADQLAALLEDTDALTSVLTYHVVSGSVGSGEVVALSEAETVQGSTVDISVNGDRVMVDNANIVAVDIRAGNGVIHVIDAVITP